MKYTYFASIAGSVVAGCALVKIGQSHNPVVRIKRVDIAQAGEVSDLVIVDESEISEKEAHDAFSRYRVSGEWFRIPCDRLATYLKGVSQVSPDRFSRTHISTQLPRGSLPTDWKTKVSEVIADTGLKYPDLLRIGLSMVLSEYAKNGCIAVGREAA